jgi:GNAT superfamily N-acetyltransferase
MTISIRPANLSDAATVSAVLVEAAKWLEEAGMRLWRAEELREADIAANVAAGLFFIAECDCVAAGVVRFQLEDPLFWPDMPLGESTYIHRLAVRREFAGRGISTAILKWAAERTCTLGRSWLRLDCDAARPKLRAVYERFGFRHHSDRQVGPYFVARYELAVGSRK